jgi:tetratricopeptide (TPR) repeat protein
VLAITHWSRGEYRHAVARASWNVRMLTGNRRLERFGMALLPSVYSRMATAVSLAELGEFDECLALGAEALSIAEASEHPQSVISACFGLGTGHMRRGNLEQAIAVLERGRTVAEATALGGAFLELVSPLASAYALSGRVAQAVELLQGAIARAVTLRNPMGHWLRSGGLGEAQLCAGRIAQAVPMARLYIEVTRSVGARGNEAWALLLLGEVLAQHEGEDAVEAERTLDSALAMARQLEMRPLEGRCHLAFGGLHGRQGALERATENVAAAAEIFRQLGMAFWLERSGIAGKEVRKSIVET